MRSACLFASMPDACIYIAYLRSIYMVLRCYNAAVYVVMASLNLQADLTCQFSFVLTLVVMQSFKQIFLLWPSGWGFFRSQSLLQFQCILKHWFKFVAIMAND